MIIKERLAIPFATLFFYCFSPTGIFHTQNALHFLYVEQTR